MKRKIIEPWVLAARWREDEILAFLKKRSNPQIRKQLIENMRSAWELANKNGIAEVLYHEKKPIAVYLLFRPKEAQIFGQKTIVMEFDSRFRAEALPWLVQRTRAHRKNYHQKTLIGVGTDPYWQQTLPKVGFRLHSQVLLGETKKAYKNLMKTKNPPANLEHLGLVMRPLKNMAEVHQVIRLQKKVFTRIPERGFFTHTPSTLKRDRKEYLQTTKSKDSALFGIWKGKRLMGFFGVFVRHDPNWGSNGGLTITLDFPIQGKGVAKTAYRVMLEHLKDREVPAFRGGTSQPAVKGLGDIMQRKVQYTLWFWKN